MPWLANFAVYIGSRSDIAIGFLVLALMTTTEFFGLLAAYDVPALLKNRRSPASTGYAGGPPGSRVSISRTPRRCASAVAQVSCCARRTDVLRPLLSTPQTINSAPRRPTSAQMLSLRPCDRIASPLRNTLTNSHFGGA